jgi:hypothetical protein
MIKKDKYLKGSDIILNLDKMVISDWDSKSSSSTNSSVSFYFNCQTKHGYMEDPNMKGEIKVLQIKKEKGCYILKVKFKPDESDC